MPVEIKIGSDFVEKNGLWFPPAKAGYFVPPLWTIYYNAPEANSVCQELSGLFPALKDEALIDCPVCESEAAKYPVAHMVPHLNDHHGWTRELIASWLETLDLDLTLQPAGAGH